MGRSVDAETIRNFEVLVDELLKAQPNENQVKLLMETLGMKYDSEPVRRIGMVLEKMNGLVFESKEQRRKKNDLQKHT